MIGRMIAGLRWPAFFLGGSLLWLIPLVLQPGSVPLWVGGEYSDLLISHWPNAWLVRHSLDAYGQVPLWNPMILSGAPFAADPLSGLWYPPFWLAVLQPAPLTFNLIFWLHLAWAGLGVMRLVRAEGAGWQGSALAGILFSGTPKLVGHVGLGHLGLVAAVAWTPWLLLAARRAAESLTGEGQGSLRWAALAGALVGLTAVVDPRWALPAGCLAGAMGLRVLIGARTRRSQAWSVAGLGAAAGLFALGTSAALSLPLLEFLPRTTRAGLTLVERSAMSLPVERLLGLLIPDLGGWPEWMAFAGVVGLTLGGAALVASASGAAFWCGMLGLCWILALGDRTPLYPLLSALPLFDSLRVPPRFLFGAALSLACLAGHGLDVILRGIPAAMGHRLNLVFVGFAALVLLLSVGMGWTSGWAPGGWSMAVVTGSLAAGLGLMSVAMRPSPRWLAAAWLVLAAGELAWVDGSLLVARSAAGVAPATAELIRNLEAAHSAGDRVFSPSYSVPQDLAALAGLELADGVNPLQLAAYVRAMGQATGMEAEPYSVTLPPFPSGDPGLDWGPVLDPDRLGLLSVRYVVSDFPVETDGLIEQSVFGDTHVYLNPAARPRAWVQPGSPGEAAGAWQPVERWAWTPNRIEVDAQGPGTLIFSEVAYPGWRASVDGAPARIETWQGVLRAVQLGSGTHTVSLTFSPPVVLVGLALSLISALALAALWIWR
jgi:hypothetical protein